MEAKFCRIYTVLVPTLRPVDCTFVLLEGRLSSEYVLARTALPGNYAVPMSMPYMGKTLSKRVKHERAFYGRSNRPRVQARIETEIETTFVVTLVVKTP